MHTGYTYVAEAMLWSPLAGALLVWLPGLRTPGWYRGSAVAAARFQDVVTIGASVLSLVLVVLVAGRPDPGHALRFQLTGVAFYLDDLSVYFVLLVSVVALATSFYVGPCCAGRGRSGTMNRTLFYCLFNLFHFTMVLVPMVANLVVLWIGIELTTVTSTVLVAAERGRDQFEAAWKYIVITSTGIIFALLGTLFLATAEPAASSAVSMDWIDLTGMAQGFNPSLVRLSFLFVLVGYGTKAGLAPMHTWLPDAHGQAPYPVSALLSGVLLKSALYAVLRFYVITNLALDDGARFTSGVLLTAGLLSLVAAVPFILKRNTFKRILAYHSLEHMGIITVGVGVGGPIALFGALLHVLNHGVTKSLMFLAFGNVQDAYADAGGDEGLESDRTAVTPAGTSVSSRPVSSRPVSSRPVSSRPVSSQPVGVLRALPWTGTALALGGLALVGSPPFSIFLSEFLILWGAVSRVVAHPSVWMSAVVAIFLVSVTAIFAGLVRHLGRMLLGDPPPGCARETLRRVLPLVVLLAVVVVLGLTVPDVAPLQLHRLLDGSVGIVCEGGGCR